MTAPRSHPAYRLYPGSPQPGPGLRASRESSSGEPMAEESRAGWGKPEGSLVSSQECAHPPLGASRSQGGGKTHSYPHHATADGHLRRSQRATPGEEASQTQAPGLIRITSPGPVFPVARGARSFLIITQGTAMAVTLPESRRDANGPGNSLSC